MDGLPGFLLAAVALAGSPGPATLSLAAAAAAFGSRRVAGYFLGILVGMIGVMTMVACGMVGLLFAVPGATPVVTVSAVLYFVWLAWRIATAPLLTDQACDRKPPNFAGGLGLALINPNGYAAGLIVIINLVWLWLGSLLTRFFRDPRTNPILNILFAVLLVASVLVAL